MVEDVNICTYTKNVYLELTRGVIKEKQGEEDEE
jgi:hypothetical protein